MHRLLLLAISLATMALVVACAGPDATTRPNKAGVGPSEIWTRQFGTSGSGAADGVAAADVGSIYVVGQVALDLPGQINHGGADAYLRAYDSGGQEMWIRQFGTAGFDSTLSIIVHGASRVYAVGSVAGVFPGQTSQGGRDGFLRVYDASSDTE